MCDPCIRFAHSRDIVDELLMGVLHTTRHRYQCRVTPRHVHSLGECGVPKSHQQNEDGDQKHKSFKILSVWQTYMEFGMSVAPLKQKDMDGELVRVVDAHERNVEVHASVAGSI